MTAPTLTRRLCETRDPEWWATDDDGNRLAILLCRVCPLGCPANDPKPAGVIRGGVAYDDSGKRRMMCACGYPATGTVRGDRPDAVSECKRCATYEIAAYRDVIIRLRAAGKTWSQIAAGGVPYNEDHIRQNHLKWTSPTPREAAA